MTPTHPARPKRELPVGVFDSGVGGLTVMKAIAEHLPDDDLLYLGDTARVPYGNKAASTVTRYSLNNTRLLVQLGVKALVVACNTASAYALASIEQAYPDIPVIGVVEPVAREAVVRSKSGRIGVIGTCHIATYLDPNIPHNPGLGNRFSCN